MTIAFVTTVALNILSGWSGLINSINYLMGSFGSLRLMFLMKKII